MKDIEREKAKKIVERIESGDFDENDIDSLFMRLRAYSSGHRVFREFGDLVAHNEERDRGLATDVLSRMHLGLRYLVDFVLKGKEVDYSRPFPNYVRKLLKLQICAADAGRLKTEFRASPERLIARVDQLFKHIKGTDEAELVADKISGETLGAFRYVISRIPATPAFTQRDLLQDIEGVLRQNRVPFDSTALNAASQRITLCAMLLLHCTRFDLGSGQSATCVISSGTTPTRDGLEVSPTLQVSGLVSMSILPGQSQQALSWVMTTELLTEDWCEPNLLIEAETAPFRRLPLHERPMGLSPRFKLNSL